MFEKQTIVDRIEVLADHTVAVRYVVTVKEDGHLFSEQVKGNYFRPGDDYSAECAKVQSICAAVQTPEVVSAYRAEQSRIAAEEEAARIKAEQEAEAQRIQAEQAAAVAEAERAAIAKAEFEKAVGDAVVKALTGGR